MTELIRALIKKYKRFIIFALIGVINTGVDFLVFKAAGALTSLAVEYCQAVGYTAGIICSFILNQSFTFRDSEKGNTAFKVARFLIVNAVTLGVSMYGIKLLVGSGINENIAKVIIIGLTMILNYIGYKLFVFRVKEN